MLDVDARRGIGFFISDTHINSAVALGKPRVQLDNGGEWVAGPLQRWIRKQYLDFLDLGRHYKATYGWPFFVIHLGETADDLTHPSTELISKNPKDLIRHGIEVLEPLVDLADFLFICRGTEAHSGKASWYDEQIAEDFGAIGPGENRFSWYKLRLLIGGVPIEAGHHPGTSARREHTRGGDANRLAADVAAEYTRISYGLQAQGDNPVEVPRLVIRGHNHFPADSGPINQPARGIILPSWQLTTSFGHRLGGKVAPIGGAVILFEGGKIKQVEHFHRYFPIKPSWTVYDWAIDQEE